MEQGHRIASQESSHSKETHALGAKRRLASAGTNVAVAAKPAVCDSSHAAQQSRRPKPIRREGSRRPCQSIEGGDISGLIPGPTRPLANSVPLDW